MKLLRCIIHRWFYVSSTNGHKHLFSGELLHREDRYCRDCGKMQIKVSQFTKERQRELIKMTKSLPCADWITYIENDKTDKATMRWLAMTN